MEASFKADVARRRDHTSRRANLARAVFLMAVAPAILVFGPGRPTTWATFFMVVGFGAVFLVRALDAPRAVMVSVGAFLLAAILAFLDGPSYSLLLLAVAAAGMSWFTRPRGLFDAFSGSDKN